MDSCYYYCSNLEFIKEKENIFRVKVLNYKGKKLLLRDGTLIQPNDLLLKIHLHNSLLMNEIKDIKTETKRALYVFNRVKRSMPDLANYLFTHPNEKNIKGIIGITILSRGVQHLGFEVHDIKKPIYRRVKQLYMKPMHIFFNLLTGKLRKNNQPIPKYIVISKSNLFQNWLICEE